MAKRRTRELGWTKGLTRSLANLNGISRTEEQKRVILNVIDKMISDRKRRILATGKHATKSERQKVYQFIKSFYSKRVHVDNGVAG